MGIATTSTRGFIISLTSISLKFITPLNKTDVVGVFIDSLFIDICIASVSSSIVTSSF